MLLRETLRHLAWRMRMTRHGIAVRAGRLMSLLLIVGALGAALGHAVIRRAAGPYEDDDRATDET